MPSNFKIVSQKKLYRSGRVAPAELKLLASPTYNVRRIVSLDQAVGNSLAQYMPEVIEHIMLPINLASNATTSARTLIQKIKDGLFDLPDGAVLVHCLLGQDRTGLAIALYRVIKQGWTCTKAIEEAESIGYGQGIADNVKRAYDIEICRSCKQNHDHKCLTISDDSAADDSHDSIFAVENYIKGLSEMKNNSNVKGRIKLLKRLLKMIKDHSDKNDLSMPENGLITNYYGIPNSSLVGPVSTVGVGLVEPAGFVQL